MYAACLSWCVLLAVQVVHSIKRGQAKGGRDSSEWVSLLKQTIFRMALSLQRETLCMDKKAAINDHHHLSEKERR